MRKTFARVAGGALVLLGTGLGALALLRTPFGQAETDLPQPIHPALASGKSIGKLPGPADTPSPLGRAPGSRATAGGPASLARERPTVEVPLKARSVEELLNTVEDLKARRADLEKREQELTAELREKLREQQERLRKHGITLSRCAGKSEIRSTKPETNPKAESRDGV